MVTPVYVPIDPNAPAGATQAPPAYSASDLANVRALRDCIVTGALPGWSYSQTVTVTSRPQYRTWTSGVLVLRMEITYGANGSFNLPLTVKWWWSNDSGATFSQIGATSTITWDTSGPTTTGIILTAVDTNGGLWCSWLSAYHKARAAEESQTTHAAATGTAVHGLGTMSTQNANAVAITGGTVNAVGITNATSDSQRINNAVRLYPFPPNTIANGANWDWNQTGIHWYSPVGYVVAGIANAQPGEIKRIFVNGAGAITINSGAGQAFYWAVGHPVWGANSTVVNFVCFAPNQIVGTTTRM